MSATEIHATNRSPAVPTMWVGTLLTLGVLVFVAVDQTSLGGIADHVQEHYAPHGTVPDPGTLYMYLYATGVLGLVTWLAMIPPVRSGRSWAPVVATLILVTALCGGVFNLVISEYGGPVLPPMWAVLTLVPCLVGMAAVGLLWRDRAVAGQR